MSQAMDQIQALESEIARKVRELDLLKRESKQHAVSQVKAIADQFNLTLEDVRDVFPASHGSSSTAKPERKVKPPFKYFDPETNKGWSGAARGKIPEPYSSIIKRYNGDRIAAAVELNQFLV